MMKINDLVNFYDTIDLSYKTIEQQISAYCLKFYPEKNEKVEWKCRLPLFVPAFYKYVKLNNVVPSQHNFWLYYCAENKPDLQKLKLTYEEKIGLRARVYRTYPSLVRDLHLGLYLKGMQNRLDIFYNETLDIKYGIDLLVGDTSGTTVGFALFTKTGAGKHARTVKEFRPKKKIEIPCFELGLDFPGSKKCGDFFLYSEKETESILEKFHQTFKKKIPVCPKK